MPRRAWIALLFAPTAHAAWPEDVRLSQMTTFNEVPQLDRAALGDAYRQLVREIGTMVANKPNLPARTTGLYGFSFDVGTQFILTEAIDRQGNPSPWDRVHPDQQAAPYHVIPTFGVRKGLPLSTEVGLTAGWISGSQTGTFSGYGRVAVLEGYAPLPDLTLQLGYGGYVGNDELDVSAVDLSATIGTTAMVGRLPGVNTARISPWATAGTIRVRANPVLDPTVAEAIGAVPFRGGGEGETPLTMPRFGLGTQFASGNVHVRVSASWVPATMPELSTGLGVTF